MNEQYKLELQQITATLIRDLTTSLSVSLVGSGSCLPDHLEDDIIKFLNKKAEIKKLNEQKED